MLANSSQFCCPSRLLHTTRPNLALQQKQLPVSHQIKRTAYKKWRGRPTSEVKTEYSRKPKEATPSLHAKRNEVGVQLLSRRLHEQLFRHVAPSTPSEAFVRIAQEHLKTHGLDPSQGSVLPDLGWTLPQLQGRTVDEHFHNIGSSTAEPWLSLAKNLASSELPPRPEEWHIQPGWTKYIYQPDGSSYCEHVSYPEHNGSPEQMLVFDVETLPEYSPYAIMACAASKNAWYAWISPWLLGQTKDVRQLVPLGDSSTPRVIAGHNVSYDRARILEEYNMEPTQNRFLDTMAFHVAVKGISSHQRPAWMKYRKTRIEEEIQQEEARDAYLMLMEENGQEYQSETDAERKEEQPRKHVDVEDNLSGDEIGVEAVSDRWEDLTSANSLADVARLHCGIEVDKQIRNDFLTCTREEILEGIHDYLGYCSLDVEITHAVYAKVLPSFLESCPSPVSFAGVLTMGSSFLTVNQEWDNYIANAERAYKELESKVKNRLVELAHEAKDLMKGDKWKDDLWLSQLDWTPKVVGKSRGVGVPVNPAASPVETKLSPSQPTEVPLWYRNFLSVDPLSPRSLNGFIPYVLRISFDNYPLVYTTGEKWHYEVDGSVMRLPTAKGPMQSVLGRTHGLPALNSGRLSSGDNDLLRALCNGEKDPSVAQRVAALAEATAKTVPSSVESDPWLRHLDWSPSALPVTLDALKPAQKAKKPQEKPPVVYWPKWYWDLTRPKKDCPPGTVDLTVRNRIAPILLRLSWQGWPLFHSRQHGWTFRVNPGADFQTRATQLAFTKSPDDTLNEFRLRDGYTFYKLPHKDGESSNVGSPLGKTFMKHAQDGTLTSPGDEAKDALAMNAQCSYWISVRDRVLKQMVVRQSKRLNMGLPREDNWGIIIPQVITMGTVTRRAIERTWLTASNAKTNRVGSELKAMVRAPPGYAIVGADVDSEELWISSVMGDAQFGLHGATALGWMTLEGTKAAGTDLHSKTASILGISRDQAKVFNYSRIYGAGMKHAVLLLLQANPGMLPDQAQKLASNLYASTKGKNTRRVDIFGRKFWFGGTESFVFNKLEEIALSDRPRTPALGCGITYALSKEYLPEEYGSDYMTSRINWVVQSSGVDYLHLLIVSMDYLIKKYKIQARYLISVHDELRYLVKDEDKYRAALALQIANLWTRCLFASNLGMDDLPQGVAFFSSVDIDKVLRKEVDMPCVTPSQPVPIPPGESLDMAKILAKTNGGSLHSNGSQMEPDIVNSPLPVSSGYKAPKPLHHRATHAGWLRAQATSDFAEVKKLAQRATGQKFHGGVGSGPRSRKQSVKKPPKPPLSAEKKKELQRRSEEDLAEQAATMEW